LARLRIRDFSNNKKIEVPIEGLIFGRDGGDADIQLADPSISRRQARISYKTAAWTLETLGQPEGQRPPRPRILNEGETFTIGRSEFEVMEASVDGGDMDDAASKTIVPRTSATDADPQFEPKASDAERSGRSNSKSKRRSAGTEAEVASDEQGSSQDEAAPGGSDATGDEAPPQSIGALFVAVPKGLAYYLLNVPKMAFNPVGTVRTGVAEQPAQTMGRIELIGYALPSMLAVGLLGSIAGGIAGLIRGAGFDFLAFVPIGPAIGAVVGALITGYFFHLVFEWLVRVVLKGRTNARSRTNYFLQFQTVLVLLAVPNFIGAILGALPIPFINLLGPLLTTLASVISLFVVYQWFVSFEVANWVKLALKILGLLAVIGAGIGFVKGVITTIQGLASSTGGAEKVEKAVAGAETELKAAQDEGETAKTEGKEAVAEGARTEGEGSARDAVAKQGETGDVGAGSKAEGPDAKLGAKNDAKTDAKTDEAVAKAPDPAPEKVTQKVAENVAEKTPERATEKASDTTRTKKAAPMAEAGGTPSVDYGDYVRKRTAIERTLAADPTILESKELKELYGDYEKSVHKLEKKWKFEVFKHQDQKHLSEHLKNAELFRKTSKQVDELAAKLGVR
jgi:hypothetical protein